MSVSIHDIEKRGEDFPFDFQIHISVDVVENNVIQDGCTAKLDLFRFRVPFHCHQDYKGSSILVPNLPKIATRCRFSDTQPKLEF